MSHSHTYSGKSAKRILNSEFRVKPHWVILGQRTDRDPTGDKTPVKKKWHLNPATVAELEERLGERKTIGLMPRSLGMAVIDIDTNVSSAKELVKRYFGSKAVFTKTRREGGIHAWIKCDDETLDILKAKSWYVNGVHCGEFRGSVGFVVMWDPSAKWLRHTKTAEDASREAMMFFEDTRPKPTTESAKPAAGNPNRPSHVAHGHWPGDSLGAEGARSINAMSQFAHAFNFGWAGGVELAIKAVRDSSFSQEEQDKVIAGGLKNAGRDGTPDPRFAPSKGSLKELLAKLDDIGIELRYETSRNLPLWRRKGESEWSHVSPADIAGMRMALLNSGFKISKSKMEHDMLPAMAWDESCRVNFARDYLEGIPMGDESDVAFLRSFLYKWGAEENAVHEYASCALWAGTYFRVMNPGVPMRGFPVLVGPAGIGKSMMVRHMFPSEIRRWVHTDEVTFEGGFDNVSRTIEGFSIAEIPESAGSSRASKEAFKKWLTQGNRSMRVLHSNQVREYKNSAYLVITANDGEQIMHNDRALLSRLVTAQLDSFHDSQHPDPREWLTVHREILWSAAKYLVEKQAWNFERHPEDLNDEILEANRAIAFRDESMEDAMELVYGWLVDNKKGATPGEIYDWLKGAHPETAEFIENPTRLGLAMRRQSWCRVAPGRKLKAAYVSQESR